MRKLFIGIALFVSSVSVVAQDYNQTIDDGTFTASGYQEDRNFGRSDSIQSHHKEIPRGLHVWTIDDKFGDRSAAVPDTLHEMYMNTIFNTGLYGEYNSLGNVGSPRQNRIFIDRSETSEFLFTDPYDYFLVPVDKFHFTSTLSPITNVSLNSAGNRTNGEDHFKALFAINAGRRWGFGFKFDYIYGRGYYSNQSTALFDYSMWGSYTGERYQANLLLSLNHQKIAESGGITNDAYITHPEIFNDSYSTEEVPTVLKRNWNRNDNQHVFFNHRYSIGFSRKVPMTKEEIEARKFAIRSEQQQASDKAKEKARRQAERNGEEFDEDEYDKEQLSQGRPEGARIAGYEPEKVALEKGRVAVNLQDTIQMDSLRNIAIDEKKDTAWLKNEYVPVTSFIHTIDLNNYRRIYQAYDSPEAYYKNSYYAAESDSIYDRTRHWSLRNTVALALLEGFNKWAKAGLKAFASYELRHFELPALMGGTDKWNKHDVSLGGQLLKTQGKAVHFDASGEYWLTGDRSGQFKLDFNSDFNFSFLGDSIQLAAHAHFYNLVQSFYMHNYHSKHFWWDELSLDKEQHSRLMGTFRLKKTGTMLRIAYDNIKNYSYLGLQNDRIQDGNNFLIKNMDVNVRQYGGAISLLTAQVGQNFHFFNHLVNWQTILTYQKSSDAIILPVPDLNVYTNLFLRFKIAKVLDCDFGADMRYFTKYNAPEYNPQLGQFAIQETETSQTKIGNYPIINVYANFFLKHARFFVMFSHVNAGKGGDYFYTPHYPLNDRIFRFGISWNFFN